MTIEKDLLARLMNADEEAFRKIFDLYVKKVYQFVYGYIKEPTQAEDITQNLFIKIWEKRTSIDIDKSFDGFIFTIAYRMVIDYYRQTKTKIHGNAIGHFADDSMASSDHSDDLLNRHQLDSLYEKALQTLPPKRKEIFLLSRHSGLSNKQIAEHLHISVKTVENQMTAALSTLREFFTNSDIGSVVFFFLFFFG